MTGARSLRELLNLAWDRHRARHGTDLERIAVSNGYAINRTTINEIRAGTYSSKPTRQTLEALAWLAGPEVTLADAYRAAKLPVPGTPFRDELPADADLMTREERDVVKHMIRILSVRHRRTTQRRRTEEPEDIYDITRDDNA